MFSYSYHYVFFVNYFVMLKIAVSACHSITDMLGLEK